MNISTYNIYLSTYMFIISPLGWTCSYAKIYSLQYLFIRRPKKKRKEKESYAKPAKIIQQAVASEIQNFRYCLHLYSTSILSCSFNKPIHTHTLIYTHTQFNQSMASSSLLKSLTLKPFLKPYTSSILINHFSNLKFTVRSFSAAMSPPSIAVMYDQEGPPDSVTK